MQILDAYIDRLLQESTPERPIWNIEKMRGEPKASWNYIDGCMIKAIIELYYITEDKKFLDFANNYVNFFISEDGKIKYYSIDDYNLDNINAAKNLFDLYKLTGKEKYKKAIATVYEQIKTQPRTQAHNFWHKKIYPNQVWLDGLYMVLPFYMKYELEYNNSLYMKDIINQFINVRNNMKDNQTGLYFHGYDESKKIFWADKKTGLSQNFWLRSLGWFAMALIDTLEVMPKGLENDRKTLENMFADFIKSILRFQDKSGMWFQLPDKPNLDNNYLETSGSAILGYAILKGVRLKVIDENYFLYGKKAFDGICDKYLYEKNGELVLGGICLVAGLGDANNTRRDGSVEYYLSEPVVENEAKGVAPLIMLYTEILRYNKHL